MANLWRVSATEVKNSWGRVVRRILQRGKPALVESKGVATVVILPADEYERLVTSSTASARKQRQLALLRKVRRLAKEVAARHPDQPLPDSVSILREMRDGRDEELLRLR